MAGFFADAATQDTRGDRGKTTRRTSTRTVRGPEGAWIAQVKEELAARPAGWLVRYELVWTFARKPAPEPRICTYGRFDTEAEALAVAATLPTGPATRHDSPNVNGWNYTSRVWVEKEC